MQEQFLLDFNDVLVQHVGPTCLSNSGNGLPSDLTRIASPDTPDKTRQVLNSLRDFPVEISCPQAHSPRSRLVSPCAYAAISVGIAHGRW